MILCLLCFGCFHKTDLPLLTSPGADQSSILIINAVIFTGNPDDGILENSNILIENGIISKISTDEIHAPDARVIDSSGKMVLPGLIDSHIHVFGSGAPPTFPALPNPERNSSAFLYAGITTVVDMGGPFKELKELAEKTETNQISGPRLFYTGRMFTCEDGHPAAMIRRIVPWLLDDYLVWKMTFEVEDGDDLNAIVLENKNHGTTFSKLAVDEIPLGIPTLNSGQVAKVVEASKQNGFLTVAHIGSEKNILTAMDGGVNIFIHGPYRSSLSDATIQRMKEMNCIVTPTVAVFDNVVRYGNGSLEFSNLDRQIADPVILAEYQKPIPDDVNPELADWTRNAAKYQDIKFTNVIQMKKAGIPILAGSDSINVASSPGATLHRELELLVTKCGFTPIEAVAAATFKPGKYYQEIFGRLPVGQLKEGGPADILIINRDFRDDIRATQDIYLVIAKGRIIERNTPISD